MLSVRNLIQNASIRSTAIRSMVTVSPPTLNKKDDVLPKEVPTHTGQKWEEDDYRRVRFLGKSGKQVNTRFAIDLINEVPPEPKKQRVVWCDGGSGPTGHPRVYINLDQPGNHTCTYCGLRFYKEDHHHH